MFGFYRVAAATPQVDVANVEFHQSEILRLYEQSCTKNVAAVAFPELSITGYSAGDLFYHPVLQQAALKSLRVLADATANKRTLMIVGAPLAVRDKLYNAAFVLGNGHILGAVPKQVLPNYREFYEKRQFRSGRGIIDSTVTIAGETVPFGIDLIFDDGKGFRFGVEICEDLWSVVPPSSYLALGGALAIFNPSAGDELVAKAD